MVYHFTSREKNILHYLSISDTYILGKQLAAVTGVSERTIRDDIKRINQVLFSEELDDFFELVSTHTKGYKVWIKDACQFRQFMKDLDYDVNTMERELIHFREREIRLLAMLMKDVTLYKLSQMLYFSESTIRSLIKKSNGTSLKSHYTMNFANGKLKVNGNEIAIRIAALKTIYVNPEYKGIPDNIRRHRQHDCHRQCDPFFIFHADTPFLTSDFSICQKDLKGSEHHTEMERNCLSPKNMIR